MENEIWQPSLQLRNRRATISSKFFPSKHILVLQQLHISNLGNTKWIDVPTIKNSNEYDAN